MFNFKRMFKFAAAAAVALGMLSCAGEDIRTASEGNMIPDNAVFAMQVNAGQLWDKALGAPGSKAHQIWAMTKKSLPLVTTSLGEIGTLANDVVNDPAKIGLCVDKPMVLSFSADLSNFADEMASGEVCLVALLDDSEAFVKTVDSVVEYPVLLFNFAALETARSSIICSLTLPSTLKKEREIALPIRPNAGARVNTAQIALSIPGSV